jgi:hypothetical protein
MVRIVRRATLTEASLVSKGACHPPYATLVDADGCRFQDCKSLRVLCDGAHSELMQALRNLAESN